MKRMVSLLLTTALMFSFGTNVFCARGENVLFSQKEITDIKEIDNRLDKGITDDKGMEAKISFNQDIFTDENGNKYKLHTEKMRLTSQKVRETINDTGEQNTEYVAYGSADVSLASPVLRAASNGGGTEEIYQSDSSSSTTVYLKVVYEHSSWSTSSSTYDMYKFTSVTGKIVRLDSTVQLVKLELNEAGQGAYYSDINATNRIAVGNLYASGTADYPTADVYYGTASVIPYYFNVDSGGSSSAYLKATATGYFKRGSSEWNYTITIIKAS